MRLLVLTVLLAVGCASVSGDENPAGNLVGSWIAPLNSICDYGVTFESNGSISMETACVDETTLGTDLAENLGTYTADATNIYVTFSQSTCSDQQVAFYEPYVHTSNNLTLTESTQVILLAPNTSAGGASGVATLGCFRAGVFTPAPLTPI